jgi:starch-binding outer membrane protein, SusD/RagB family
MTKKLKWLIPLLACCIACTKEKIFEESNNFYLPAATSFTSIANIDLAVSGMYNAAQIGQFDSQDANGGRGYIWGAAFIQQGDCRGEDVVNINTFFQSTYQNFSDQYSLDVTYYWTDGYRLINRCNIVIEGVKEAMEKGIISTSAGEDYIGQARFLRAITHFELLMYFARSYADGDNTGEHPGIPYREVGINTQAEIDSELLKGRNTVAECYGKILADLNYAELKIKNQIKIKATKYAAIAFKTRVYLHQRQWNRVMLEGKKLDLIFTLTKNPEDCFGQGAYNNTESIFSIAHSANVNPGPDGALASLYKKRLQVCISPIIWNEKLWLLADKRRENNVMVFSPTSAANSVKFTNKYNDITNYTDPAPVIRYAEVLLNMAEAQARLGNETMSDLAIACEYLNKVRDRSLKNLSDTYVITNSDTKKDLLERIIAERRIEFLMEGRRWADIHRLVADSETFVKLAGIPRKCYNTYPQNAVYSTTIQYTLGNLQYSTPSIKNKRDREFLWPIPSIETRNNPTLAAQQNPGW